MSLRIADKPVGRSRYTRNASQAHGRKSMNPAGSILGIVGNELKLHAPFTFVGALTGIAIMVFFTVVSIPRSVSASLFWGLHPLHVLLSALVTAGMYRLHSRGKLWTTILIGYFGSAPSQII